MSSTGRYRLKSWAGPYPSFFASAFSVILITSVMLIFAALTCRRYRAVIILWNISSRPFSAFGTVGLSMGITKN